MSAVRGRWWIVIAAVTAAALVATVAAVVLVGPGEGGADEVEPGETPAFGVLASSCDPGRVAELRRAGVTTVVTELQWASAVPAPDSVDESYLDAARQRIDTCAGAGMRVVLGLGLQNPPGWVLGEPGTTFVDQFGATTSRGEANLVFSATARQAATQYLRAVGSQVGFADVATVRLAGELGYPGPQSTDATSFWAYDPAAQGGPGLADGVVASPMPGWRPGEDSWQGAPVGDEQVSDWYDWYTGALAGSVGWLADTLRAVGFGGNFQVPLAGRGVLPADRDEAVAGLLAGGPDPDGALGRGLDYPRQFPAFADLGRRLGARVLVDFTGLDDDTATRARAADPGSETCQPGDTPQSLTDGGQDRGANQRWTVALAREAGLAVVAENPGPPDLPNTGGSRFSDSLAEQMDAGARYAPEGGHAAL